MANSVKSVHCIPVLPTKAKLQVALTTFGCMLCFAVCWKLRCWSSGLYTCLMHLQVSGNLLTAFVYVWAPEFVNMLDPVPWDFETFMHNDFRTYWAAELESSTD